MRRTDDPLFSLLPFGQIELLRQAVGHTLIEIDRHTAVTFERHVHHYQRDPSQYFARVSGPTDFKFSDGLVHSIRSWPSELSLTVEATPMPDHPDLIVLHLSQSSAVPDWIRGCLGRRIVDVCVYTYREDGVDSPEARQCAISYIFEPAIEMIYCTYLHGGMDGDELVGTAELCQDLIAQRFSIVHGDLDV